MEKTIENLRRNGFEVTCFADGEDAAAYIADSLHRKTVGIGGSMTVRALNIYDRIKDDNRVFWHMAEPGDGTMVQASSAEVYITSANAISEEGYIINIDGRGNRVAGTLMKKEKVYIVVGKNKLCGPFAEALDRARNQAAPPNAKRLDKKTPCAMDGKCRDCSSPDRICNALVVLWRKPGWCESMEILLIDGELGF